MNKWIIRIGVFVSILLVLAFFDVSCNEDMKATIFTITGIMFPIGISVLVSVDLSGIGNRSTLKLLRSKINKIEKLFAVLFVIATGIYILSGIFRRPISIKWFSFHLDTISIEFNLFVIYYYIVNYQGIIKLKNEITDTIQAEKRLAEDE